VHAELAAEAGLLEAAERRGDRTELFELMLSVPVSSALAVRSAFAPSRVQMEPERPYGVSFAILIASASSSKG
jgi:hypothetical protein